MSYTDTFTSPRFKTSILLRQTTAAYTIQWNDPASARTLTVPDPGAADTFAFLTATQTFTNKTLGSTCALGANLNAGSFKITSLLDPTSAQDAATKNYVDISSGTTATVTASQTLAAGSLINVYNSAGALTAQLADASLGLPAQGWVNSSITSGATGTANLGNGTNTGVSGLTLGSQYFLGNAGALTTTAPTTAGYIFQNVGEAISATKFAVVLHEPITRG